MATSTAAVRARHTDAARIVGRAEAWVGDIIAFVDESESDRRRDPGVYILAATIAAPETLVLVRDALQTLRLPGQKKLHWRDEGRQRRLVLARTVGRLPLQHVVVLREGAAAERTERRRRLCMRQLVMELGAAAVTQVVAESRGPADDARDRIVVDAFRRQSLAGADTRIHHRPGPQEPLLWAADIVCGAFAASRVGHTEGWTALEGRCTVRRSD